jgi:outer membrane protein insertion porin family
VPVTGRTAIGMRAKAGKIFNYGGDELPYYQRYFLGGETEIRGVDVRTVGPINSNNAALGGTSFVLFNAEYYYDILPQVRALAFHDAGQAYADGKPMDLRQLRTSTGFEVRVTLPVINVPFRLIYAWNFYRDAFQPPRGFRFAVGTTF